MSGRLWEKRTAGLQSGVQLQSAKKWVVAPAPAIRQVIPKTGDVVNVHGDELAFLKREKRNK